MADATSKPAKPANPAKPADQHITLEFHGALAERLAELGRRRGSRTLVSVAVDSDSTVSSLLTSLAGTDARYAHLYDVQSHRLPEHVEVVLNDRVIELQGGLQAR